MNANAGHVGVGTGNEEDAGPGSARPRMMPLEMGIFGFATALLLWIGMGLWLPWQEVLVANDPILYVAGSRGLARTGSYVLTEVTGTPRVTLYPPAQSVLYSGTWLGNPGVVEAERRMRWVSLLVGVASACLGARLAMNLGLSRWTAALFGLACVANGNWVYLSCNYYSEPQCILWLLGAACLLTGPRRGTAAGWLAVGLCFAAAYLTRTAAQAFLAVAGLHAVVAIVLRRDFKPSLAVLPGVVAYLGWAAWTRGSMGYGQVFREMVESEGLRGWAMNSAAEAVRYVFGIHWARIISGPAGALDAFLHGRVSWLPPLAAWVLGPLISLLFLRSVRGKGADGGWVLLAVGLYTLQLVLWPANIEARGALPLLPFVLAGALVGAKPFLRWAGPSVATKACNAVLAVSVVGSIAVAAVAARGAHRAEEQRLAEFDGFIRAMNETVPPGQPVGIGPGLPLQSLHLRSQHPLESIELAFLGPTNAVPPRFWIMTGETVLEPAPWTSIRLASKRRGWVLIERRE